MPTGNAAELTLREKEERLAHLSDVLLEHILSFEEKIDEVADTFDERINAIVDARVEQRLKELGHGKV